jgi:photosystem II stability/assembly factor-like uncharacterized protein
LTQSFKDLLLNDRNPNHVFIAGYAILSGIQVMAMHVSLDGGDTWDTYSLLETASGGSVPSTALAVAFDPANDRTVYLGGSIDAAGALFKSLDGGTSWTKIAAGAFADPVLDLAVDPSLPNRLFAGTEGGLFLSENGGAAWTRLTASPAGCIYLDPAATSSITIAGSKGVYASADRGGTWTDLNATLPVRNVLTLGVNPATKTIFAGTNGGGVFRYRQSSRFVLSLSATTGGTTDPAPGNHEYAQGTPVTVTALPEAHHEFTGWTGSATGTTNPLLLVMDSEKSLTAAFQRVIYPVLDPAGVKALNRGVLSAEYINTLTWRPNPDNADVRAVRVYLASPGPRALLAELPPSTTEFRQRRVAKDTVYVYMLIAVDAAGREATVTIR